MESRHIACHHGKGSDQNQSAAQLPEAASAKSWPHELLPTDVGCSQRLDVANDAHRAGGDSRATTALDGGPQRAPT